MPIKEKAIISEIVERAEAFESRQAKSLSDISEATDLFKVRPPKRASNTFSNPRQTEFYRACSAVGTLTYRMMTSADPFYEARSMQLGVIGDQIDTLRHAWDAQLRWARYRENLLRACRFAPVYGTVICQEDYRVMGVSAFGRRVPTTVLMPRVLDQVMFDAATTNIHEAEWLATADITGNSDLIRLAQEAKDINAPWNPKALEAASKDKSDQKATNWRALERIRRHGYSVDEALKSKRELLMFYGKLDCMNDGVEYIAAVVNRKYLVRFHANRLQHGRRPFRVAKWIDFDGALGLGNYHLLAGQHRSMDANRQAETDLTRFGAYSMFSVVKDSIAPEDAVIAPLKFLPVDRQGDIAPIGPDYRAAQAVQNLDERLKQEFRAASLASDTLQAIAADVTATASSLAQNEAMRAISVIAEQMAEGLVREHLESLHANNVQNIDAPFNINKAGIAQRVYPSDLRIDVDIKAKCVTDKDFTPKRLQDLQALLATLVSTKSNHPDLMQIDIKPIVREMATLLQVSPSELILQQPGAGSPMGGLDAQAMLGMGGMGAGNMGPSIVSTPAGPTMAS